MLEKKVLMITENIEMDLLSSESRIRTSVQKTLHCAQERREHPLVLDDPEPKSPVQSRHPDPDPPEYTEEIEIEMEVFPPLRISDSELVDQSEHPSIVSAHAGGAWRRVELRPPGSALVRGRCGHMMLLSSHDWLQTDGLTPKCRVHWRRRTPQSSRLVVTDVVCLPADYGVERSDRLPASRGKERAALSAVGLTARVTIDRTWSAEQVESRLVAVFTGERPLSPPRRRLTFLQCVPGSRVLFVPQTPASGWTGDQVLRISALSVLYVVCHNDDQQVIPPS